jgi:hypothetical protein
VVRKKKFVKSMGVALARQDRFQDVLDEIVGTELFYKWFKRAEHHSCNLCIACFSGFGCVAEVKIEKYL